MNIYDDIASLDADRTWIVHGDREISGREFLGGIAQLSDWLSEQGVKPGDRVGLKKLSNLDLLTGYYACARIGAIAVPIPFDDAERIEGAMAATNARLAIDCVDHRPEKRRSEDAVASARTGIHEALVIFTSGTTSRKLKGVRLAHDGICGTCAFMNRTMEVDQSIRELVFAPLDHAYGFGRCHSVLTAQGVLVLPKSLGRLSLVLDLLSERQCNAMAATPAIFASLLRGVREDFQAAAANLRWIQTGAMRFDAFFRETLLEALPDTRIFLHYGLSEAMRVTFFELNRNTDKIHTEGPAADGVLLEIRDDSNQPLPQGQEGTIAIRGRNLCLGYVDDAVWQQNLRDGWFITSDRASLDEDGFLVFGGRTDDTINVNGILVHPDEIESKILKAWPNEHFSVIGLPDPQRVKDTIVVLCVEGGSEITLAALRAKMADSDKHLIPQKVATVKFLPMTRTGKINRVELRAMVNECIPSERTP